MHNEHARLDRVHRDTQATSSLPVASIVCSMLSNQKQEPPTYNNTTPSTDTHTHTRSTILLVMTDAPPARAKSPQHDLLRAKLVDACDDCQRAKDALRDLQASLASSSAHSEEQSASFRDLELGLEAQVDVESARVEQLRRQLFASQLCQQYLIACLSIHPSERPSFEAMRDRFVQDAHLAATQPTAQLLRIADEEAGKVRQRRGGDVVEAEEEEAEEEVDEVDGRRRQEGGLDFAELYRRFYGEVHCPLWSSLAHQRTVQQATVSAKNNAALQRMQAEVLAGQLRRLVVFADKHLQRGHGNLQAPDNSPSPPTPPPSPSEMDVDLRSTPAAERVSEAVRALMAAREVRDNCFVLLREYEVKALHGDDATPTKE